jgi:RimJ/RimL family protein N-acetyltransferase
MNDLSRFAQPAELSDGRVRLRALRAADKPAAVAALNDELVGRFLLQPPYPYGDGDFDEFLRESADSWPLRHAARWAMVDGDDAYLGAISLDITAAHETGEIGYHVAPWCRRQGVASAALRLVRDWAFDVLGLQRLELTADVDNLVSQRVAQGAGFRREGVIRGHLLLRGQRRDSVLFGMTPADHRTPAVPLPLPAGRLTDGLVVVRPFSQDDATAVQSACNDPDIARWIYGLPAPYTLADAERFIGDAQRSLIAGERARSAVCNAADGKLVGSVSLDLHRERQAGEIGYWIAREARRHGFAAAAARLVVAWAFDDLHLGRLEIMTYPDNAASQALAAKLGFRREGVLRGYLPAEPGESRAGSFAPPADAAPARIDQVVFSLLVGDRPPAG